MNIWKAIGAVAVIMAIAAGTSYARVHVPASQAMDYRDVTVTAYYRYGVMPDSIVFDIWSLGDEASVASVLGGFMSFAGEMKDRDFKNVILAYRGEARFILSGDHFSEIGQEAEWQNPVYLLRTFPEKLEKPDGTAAFSTWSGGMIGVLGAQMEDVNKLAAAWFLEDELRSQ